MGLGIHLQVMPCEEALGVFVTQQKQLLGLLQRLCPWPPGAPFFLSLLLLVLPGPGLPGPGHGSGGLGHHVLQKPRKSQGLSRNEEGEGKAERLWVRAKLGCWGPGVSSGASFQQAGRREKAPQRSREEGSWGQNRAADRGVVGGVGQAHGLWRLRGAGGAGSGEDLGEGQPAVGWRGVVRVGRQLQEKLVMQNKEVGARGR